MGVWRSILTHSKQFDQNCAFLLLAGSYVVTVTFQQGCVSDAHTGTIDFFIGDTMVPVQRAYGVGFGLVPPIITYTGRYSVGQSIRLRETGVATLGWNIHIIMSYKDASMCTWHFSKYTSLTTWLQRVAELGGSRPHRAKPTRACRTYVHGDV